MIIDQEWKKYYHIFYLKKNLFLIINSIINSPNSIEVTISEEHFKG